MPGDAGVYHHCKYKSRARPFGRTGLTGGAIFAIDYLYTQRLCSRLSIWPTISGQADIDTFSVIHITASTTSFNCFIVAYNAALTDSKLGPFRIPLSRYLTMPALDACTFFKRQRAVAAHLCQARAVLWRWLDKSDMALMV